MSGLKLARNASRLDLEKEVLYVSISDARSHPLAPTITSRLPGRPEMYTAEQAHVKALHLVSAFTGFKGVEVSG
jgi:hypothetical protein